MTTIFLIRPNLSQKLFDSEDEAISFVKSIPEYEGLDYSLEPNFEGKYRIICHHSFRLTREQLAVFPKPYTIISEMVQK